MAQRTVDTNFIKRFRKLNTITSISGISRTVFRFDHINNDQTLNKRRIEANTSAFTGFSLDYKWLSIDYDFQVPRTALDNDYPEGRVSTFNMFFLGKKFGIEGDYQKYSGLVLPVKTRRGQFDHFNSIVYRSYSVNMYYFLNYKHFSYNSAYNYSLIQAKSAGSIVTLLSPAYQEFGVSDTTKRTVNARDRRFIQIIRMQPKWFTLLGRGGYSYNFILKKGIWTINPSFLLGLGAETPLNDSRIFSNKLGLVNSYQGRLNFGYNGKDVFVCANILLDKTTYHLDDRRLDVVNNFYAFCVGYRFRDLKKKILWVL